MAVVRYRTCTIEGQHADAILAWRENLAVVTAAVQAQLDLLTGTRTGQPDQEPAIDAQQPDERVVLVGQTAVPLDKLPVGPVVLSQASGQAGQLYRGVPRLAGAVQVGTPFPASAALYGTVDRAALQWQLAEPNAGDLAFDSSPRGANGVPAGSLAAVTAGPLGSSRTFAGGANDYFHVPTGLALGDTSQSGLAWRRDTAAWAWVQASDLTVARPVLAFGSPANTSLVGTAVSASPASGGPSFVLTGAGTQFTTALLVRDRVTIGSDPAVYEVQSITDNLHVVLVPGRAASAPPVAGATILLAGPDLAVRNASAPENRNTLYGLSIRSDGRVRAYWQHRHRQTVEAVGTAVVPAGADAFVGFQRRLRRGPGTVVTPAPAGGAGPFPIMGTDTQFTDWAPGQWVVLDGEDHFHQIVSIGSATSMMVATEPDQHDAAQATRIGTLRTTVHTGDMAGTFTTDTVDGLPGPTGGTEARAGNSGLTNSTVVCRGELQVGRDPETGVRFVGTMDCVSLFTVALDTLEAGPDYTAGMRRHWALAYPDFRVDGQTVRRSEVSDIPDPATVYAAYRFAVASAGVHDTLDRMDRQTSGLLASLGNTSAQSTDQLAEAIGAPVPTEARDPAVVRRDLAADGLVVADGLVLTPGTDDLRPYAELVRTVGSQQADLLVDRPAGAFILVALTEDVHPSVTVDACGRPSTTTVVTERVVGIDRPLYEAALAAGFSNTAQLFVKLWWIGQPAIHDASILKLRAAGLTSEQIAAALTVQSSDRLRVFVIQTPDIRARLNDLGLTDPAIDELLARPDGQLPAVNLVQTPNQVATAVLTGLSRVPTATIDGDPNPRNPAIQILDQIDLGRVFGPDGIVTDAVLEADQDCAALAVVITDAFACVSDVMDRVSAVVSPIHLHQAATIGTNKLAVQRYIPCIANVSLTAALPEFRVRLDQLNQLFRLAEQEAARAERQVNRAVDAARTALCVPRTLIAALRGGVCGVEQPKEIAERRCPRDIDLLIDQLERLLVTADLLLRKIAEAAGQSTADLELAGGAASSLSVDASLPCIGPVVQLLASF